MNRAEILTFGYRGRIRPKYGFYMHVYRPSMLKKKEPFIKYYKLQYIYRSCVSLFAYVHCLRCACGPMVVFSSFFSFFALVSLEFYYYCFGFCLLTVVFLVCVVCFHFQWKSSSDHFNHVSYS